MPKNILFLDCLKNNNFGGSEVVLLSILKSLDQEHFPPYVIISGEGKLAKGLNSIGIEPIYIDIVERIEKSFNPLKLLVHLYKAIHYVSSVILIIRNQKIVLIHTINESAHLFGGIAGKLAGVPVILHMHDIRRSRLSRYIFSFISTILPTKIISVSGAVKTNITSVGIFREKIENKTIVIYNGVNLQNYSPSNCSRRIIREFDLSSSDLTVALIAQICVWKGQREFIKAARKVVNKYPRSKFLIVGEPLYDNKNYDLIIKKDVEQKKLLDNIIFTGYREDISEIIKSVDIIVSASHDEPFGLILIESMAMAKPIIATRTGASLEIVLDGETGLLVPSKDPDALAKAMIYLKENPEIAEIMGKKGRRRVEENFDVELQVKNIVKIYEQILSKRYG